MMVMLLRAETIVVMTVRVKAAATRINNKKNEE